MAALDSDFSVLLFQPCLPFSKPTGVGLVFIFVGITTETGRVLVQLVAGAGIKACSLSCGAC